MLWWWFWNLRMIEPDVVATMSSGTSGKGGGMVVTTDG